MGSSQSNIAKKVDLSNKGIRDLEKDVRQPRMLPTFPRLEYVDLRKNKIESIPESIVGDLNRSPLVIEHLATLKISKNKLQEIPDCFFTLVNLKVLNVSNNEITRISDKVLYYYRLEELYLDNNRLTRIPWGLHRLHELKAVSIEGNLIQFLPNTLAKMKKLLALDFRPNPLDSIYDNIYTIDDLLLFLAKQKVPKVYHDDASTALEADRQKEEKLSEAGRMVRSLLKYREGMEALETHTAKEHNAENLNFYKVLRDFRRKYNSPVEIRHQNLINEAKAIFDKYIADNGSEQVNLPAEATETCRKAFLDTFNYPKGINQWIFAETYKASFDLMVRDTFQRFRLTPIGKDLIAQLERIEAKKAAQRRQELGR